MAYKFISFGYETIEDNTGFLFWQTSNMWSQEQDKILKRIFKISQLHYVILASAYWLYLHNIEVTQSFLSKHTKIEKMTISKNIQMLEEMGYVFRQCHSSDKRANMVCLTQEGIDLLEQAAKIVIEHDRKFFASLGKNINNLNKKLITLIEGNKKKAKQPSTPEKECGAPKK